MNMTTRTQIDLPNQQNHLSREAAFGLWREQTIYLHGEATPLPEDGLAYQEKMRDEWDDRFSGSI
jgi:hypothetical protein